MKRNVVLENTILVGILLFLFSACTDDSFISKGTINIKEGVAVNLAFNYSTTQQKIQTRVVQDTETEYNVTSLYLFVFNSDGTIDSKGNAIFSGGKYSETEGTARGKVINFTAHSGKEKKIYAIANADASAGDMSTSRLEEVQNEDDLRDLQVTLNNKLNIDRLAFLMAGTIVDDAGNEVQMVDIDENGNIYPSGSTELLTKNLLLRRVDARVTFKIKVDITKDTEAQEGTIANATFIPRSFEVHNLPSSSHIYAVPEQITTTYASMNENTSLPFDSEEKDDMWFNFYMFENHQDVSSDNEKYITSDKKRLINPNAENLYALREQKNTDGSFIFAPENATYVIFKGDLSYQRTSNGVAQWVNAAVEYTVHLGETGEPTDADKPEKVNNYTVNRNTFYTYNVTIQGLESIRVEVQENKEVRPGYEGDVIVAGAQVKSIDSHYGRSLIKLTKKDIEGGLSWVIQTKYDQGVKVANSPTNTLKDYKWILFAINKEFGISRGTTINGESVDLVKFPGYGAYDGGANTINNVPGDATLDVGNKNDWKQQLRSGQGEYANAYYKDYVSYLDDDACLRDINQLINHLSIEAKSNSDIFEEEDGEEVVYITAFIDEYIYTYNPQKEEFRFPGSITSSDTDRLKLWKDVVNGEDRLMHVCTGEAKYSPDGNSSWSNSVVTFKQSPIYSIYNEDDPDLATAWGTESIIETGALPLSSTHGPTGTLSNTDNNGRLNTLNFFINGNTYVTNGTKWGDVLQRTNSKLTSEDELKTGYKDIWHACMIRNRDLNGNNVIDPEEVRWFLASIDELTDLWIGEATMPSEAKLYGPNPNNPSAQAGTYRLHVASSSYNRNGNNKPVNSHENPTVIWAEEGASKGAASGSWGSNETGKNYIYRCVRYLGLSLDNISETPEDYVVATKQLNNGHYILSLSKLGRLAKRTAYDQGMELPDHKEREANNNNKPYEKFEVIMSPTGAAATGRYWKTFGGVTGFESMLNYSGRSKLCPEGYRVPNQRELMLMYTSIPDWGGGNYWCATKFSFNSNDKNSKFYNRPGFAYNSPNMVLVNLSENEGSGSNVKNTVRCVRDLTN